MSPLNPRSFQGLELSADQHLELVVASEFIKARSRRLTRHMRNRAKAILDLAVGVDRRVISKRYDSHPDAALRWWHKYLERGADFLWTYDRRDYRTPENEP